MTLFRAVPRLEVTGCTEGVLRSFENRRLDGLDQGSLFDALFFGDLLQDLLEVHVC